MPHHQLIQNNAELFNAEKGKYSNNRFDPFHKGRKHQTARFIPFENFESIRPDDLHPSKISKAPDHEIYILRKFRKHQIGQFVPFENFEDTRPGDLYRSKISKALCCMDWMILQIPGVKILKNVAAGKVQ